MQLYEENEEVLNDDAIDIIGILDTMWKNFRKYWKRLLALLIVVSGIFIGYSVYNYEAVYESYVTFVVTKDHTNNVDSVVAQRIANSFPYLLRSAGLESQIRKDMELSGTEAFPVSLTAANMEDTNFLTVTAVSGSATQAQQAADAIVDHLENYIGGIAGNTSLTAIDRTGFPESPKNPQNMIMVWMKGLGIGMIAVLGVLFLIAYSDHTIRRYEDLKKYLNILCLGTIPLTKFKKRKQVFDSRISIKNDKIPSSFPESVRTLRTRVEKEMRNQKLKTILISSSIPGEGKTTVALNLALAFAEIDKKVLLIDGDLRNPTLHTRLGINQKDITCGITDVLLGKVHPVKAIIAGKEENLHLILGRKHVENASELLSSRRMREMLEELRDYDDYDYIIVDTPPAAMMADASVVAAYTDAVLYVIRQDYADVRYIREGIGLLSDSDTHVLGCVLNCAEAGIGGYGYGKYGYGKYGYGKYLSETEE